MSQWEQEQRAAAEDAVREALPADTAEAVLDCEAFGAVVGKLYRVSTAGADRVEVLTDLDPDDLAFVTKATTPAAYLASLIHY
jgi:hypothetical protein